MGCVKQIEDRKVMVDLTVNDEPLLDTLRDAVDNAKTDWVRRKWLKKTTIWLSHIRPSSSARCGSARPRSGRAERGRSYPRGSTCSALRFVSRRA